MNPTRTTPAAPAASCADDACCAPSLTPISLPAARAVAPAAGVARARFRVATMDCAVEESEIRRAVEGIAGVRSLSFNLGQRTLSLDAAPAAVEQALAAIRRSGFDPQPLAEVPAEPGLARHGARSLRTMTTTMRPTTSTSSAWGLRWGWRLRPRLSGSLRRTRESGKAWAWRWPPPRSGPPASTYTRRA